MLQSLFGLAKVRLHGIDPGCHQVCPSCPLSSHSQCSLLWWFPGLWILSCTGGQIWDYKGYLDPHHSPGAHLLKLVWWHSQWVKWGCLPGLCRWYHWLNWLEFKKGVCIRHFIPGVSCPEAPSVRLHILEGLGLPYLVPPPLSSLKVSPPLIQPPVGNCGWSDLGCHSDNSTSPPAECPSLLWQGIQWTLSVMPSMPSEFCCWLIPPWWHSLPPGMPPMQKGLQLADCLWTSPKERSSSPWAYLYWLWAGYEILLLPPPSQPPMPLGDNWNTSFLITTCLEVCNHCFKLLRQPTIEAAMASIQ